MQKKLLRLPRRRFHRVLIYLGTLLLTLVLVDQVWVWWDRRIAIEQSTTRLTAPLSLDGYPDYLAAINKAHGAGVTAENNGAIPIFRAIGLNGLTVEQTDEMFRLWGTPKFSGPWPMASYRTWCVASGVTLPDSSQDAPVVFDGATVDRFEDPIDSELEMAREMPWVAGAHPILAKWLNAIGPALELMERGSQCQRFYMPAVLSDGASAGAARGAVLQVVLPSLGPLREMANAVVARAMMRLHGGDIEGYSRDVLICARLARLMTQEPTLIEHLVGVAIDTMAMRAIQAGAVSNLLDPKSAGALRQEVERLGPMPSPAHVIDECERYMILDAVCTTHAEKTDGPVVQGIGRLSKVIPLSYNQAMRNINAFYDSTVTAFSQPSFADRQKELEKLNAQLEGIKGMGLVTKLTHLEDLFMAIFAPSLEKVNVICTSNVQERDLAMAALALRVLHADGRAYPGKLEELGDQAPPTDRFTDLPLKYERKGKGYLIYSVGANLKDDRGVRGNDESKGDLAVVCNN